MSPPEWTDSDDCVQLLQPQLSRDEAWNCFYALTQYIELQGYPLELDFERFWDYVQTEL